VGDPAADGFAAPALEDSGPDDRELMRRHVAGDPDAFTDLVRRHRDRLWAVAVRTLGDPDDAADAVQDALVSAFRSASSFRGEAQISTWLHRIVVNACVDRMRRKAARPTVAMPDEERAPADPRDAVGARELSLDVLAALRALPVEQATALVLVDIEGWPVDVAAAMLDVPAGTVKSRCARGRARLAESLAHLRPGGNPTPGGSVLPAQADAPAPPGEEVGSDVTP